MNRTQNTSPETGNPAEFPTHDHSIREIARFLCVVRARKEIVIMALVVSCLLGGLYYLTAPRIYVSEASLLVMQPGGKTLSTEMSGERVARDMMPTFTYLSSCEAVLKDAVEGLAPDHRGDLADVPREEWPRVLGENLSTSARRNTNILDVRYLSRDPETAAAVVDAVLTSYVDYMNQKYKDAARDMLDHATKEKEKLDREIYTKQQEFMALRQTVGELAITEGGERGVNVVLRRALDTNAALIKANEQRIAAESNLRALEAAIARGEDLHQYVLSMDASVGHEVILQQFGLSTRDALMASQITRELLADKAELQSLLQTYGVQHQRVREMDNRIAVTESFLLNRSDVQSMHFRRMSSDQIEPALLQAAHQRLQMAVELEDNIHASYEVEKNHALALDQSATELRMAETNLERLNTSFDEVMKRMTDIDSGEESGLRTAVTSEPKVCLTPVSPRLRVVALMSCLLGALVGLGVVYLQDLLDDRFRSPEDLQEQTGVPVLAMIRKLDPLEDGVGVEKIHVHVRQSGADAESFRTLRTALAFAQGGVQRIVVSSTEPGDGKTTITVNLAAAIAQSGHKTLLIDADMRRPGTTPLLGLRGQTGLSMILRDTAPVAESARANIHESLIENLDVIPSGLRPVNPMELLASNRFADLLAWAEVEYEQIIVDSPPALAVSDSAIIGRLVDGVILIVRPEKNRRRLVVRAVESFPSLGVNVLGTVINHVDADKGSDYYGYGYGYGYGYSYGHDDSAEAPPSVEQLELLPQRVDRAA